MGPLLARIALACLALCLFAGCSDEAGDRQEISGEVSFQGAPLETGSIEFLPLHTGESDVVTKSGAPITGGKYSIPRLQGLVPGRYRVSITSAPQHPPDEVGGLPGPSGPSPPDRIPPEYNIHSNLEVTVTASESNTFDFDIP